MRTQRKPFHLLAFSLLFAFSALVAPRQATAQQTTVKQFTPQSIGLLAQDPTTGANVDGLAGTLVASYTVNQGTTETTGTGTFVAKGNGGYAYLPSSAELAILGVVMYRFHVAGMVDYWREIKVVSNTTDDVYALLGANQTAALAAIGGIPNAAANAAAVWAATTRTLSAFAFTPSVTVAGYASGQDPATLVLAGNVSSGVTLGQAILNSMRNLKSYQAAKDTNAHTQLVKYYIPSTSDATVQAGTGTPLFTAMVHYATDNVTLLYTSYN